MAQHGRHLNGQNSSAHKVETILWKYVDSIEAVVVDRGFYAAGVNGE